MAKKIKPKDKHKKLGKASSAASAKASKKAQAQFRKLADDKRHAASLIQAKKKPAPIPIQKNTKKVVVATTLKVSAANALAAKKLIRVPVNPSSSVSDVSL